MCIEIIDDFLRVVSASILILVQYTRKGNRSLISNYTEAKIVYTCPILSPSKTYIIPFEISTLGSGYSALSAIIIVPLYLAAIIAISSLGRLRYRRPRKNRPRKVHRSFVSPRSE